MFLQGDVLYVSGVDSLKYLLHTSNKNRNRPYLTTQVSMHKADTSGLTDRQSHRSKVSHCCCIGVSHRSLQGHESLFERQWVIVTEEQIMAKSILSIWTQKRYFLFYWEIKDSLYRKFLFQWVSCNSFTFQMCICNKLVLVSWAQFI